MRIKRNGVISELLAARKVTVFLPSVAVFNVTGQSESSVRGFS
jgi:hypothetical protein